MVENSPSARRLLQDILLRLGGELPNLRAAGSVAEALLQFASWRPDVVFVDMELGPIEGQPEAPPPSPHDPKDGAELAQLFLRRDPQVRIVICSATDPSDPRLVDLREEPNVAFLVKPLLAVRVDELLRGLRTVRPPRTPP